MTNVPQDTSERLRETAKLHVARWPRPGVGHRALGPPYRGHTCRLGFLLLLGLGDLGKLSEDGEVLDDLRHAALALETLVFDGDRQTRNLKTL